jgi:hypothetical protein
MQQYQQRQQHLWNLGFLPLYVFQLCFSTGQQKRESHSGPLYKPKKLFEARPYSRIEEFFLVASQSVLDSLIRHEPDYGNKYKKEAGYPNTHISGQGRSQVE